MEASSLSATFIAVVRGTPAPEPELAAALRAFVAAASGIWPSLGVGEAEFVAYVAARAEGGRLQPIAYARDLLLACACCRGSEAAIDRFLREFGPVMDRVLSHRGAGDLADDARQILQERLLVGDPANGRPPKIAAYRGLGPLRAWVASTAATTLLMLRRSSSRRHEQPEEPSVDTLGVQLDPELDYLEKRYKVEAEEAIVHALGQLGDRERTLLRLHLGERSSIDALGAMYSVSRATAARWLAAARSSLIDAARARLRSRLQLSESECDSLVALVNGRLHVSIVRRLSEG